MNDNMRKKFDIDGILDGLIIKYRLDRFHPRFQKRRKAIECLLGFFKDIEKEQLILVGYETDCDYIQDDCDLKECQVVCYSQAQMNPTILKELKDRDGIIVVVSFFRRRETMSVLLKHGIKAHSIYDYFDTHNLLLEGNYYDIFGDACYKWEEEKELTIDYRNVDINEIFFWDRRNYELAQEPELKEMYLARMIFDCVHIRDFLTLDRYIDEYIDQGFAFKAEYHEFRSHVKSLWQTIKQKMAKRTNEDIIMFWLDDLDYNVDENMPFLRSLVEKAVDFENAYTTTPYTTPTARALFTGKYVVDDRSYKIRIDENSSFIKNIQSKGFRFIFYTFLKIVDQPLKGTCNQGPYVSLSETCWKLVGDMLNSDVNVCAVIHEMIHTHPPNLSFGLTQSEYIRTSDVEQLDSHEIEIQSKQLMESVRYTDNVLRFYDEVLPANAFKIYMTDHGSTAEDRIHTIFRVVQRNLKSQKIKKVFSYINFEKLIDTILSKDQDFTDVLCDYALIQDVDYYNKLILKHRLSQNEIDLWAMPGYKGVVTEKDRYLRYNDGREMYFNHQAGGSILTEERENYLKQFCTEYPRDILQEDKFKYSRNAYRTRDNYYKRNGTFEIQKKEAVDALFEMLSDYANLAIRGGGAHTFQMWFKLNWDQRRKIRYIIDFDKNCIAARLGLEVISPDELENRGIDIVLVSSLQYEKAWCEELKSRYTDIKVVGLYQYFESRGVFCKRPFYLEEITLEDAVWEE